jgi:hypothetical protein
MVLSRFILLLLLMERIHSQSLEPIVNIRLDANSLWMSVSGLNMTKIESDKRIIFGLKSNGTSRLWHGTLGIEFLNSQGKIFLWEW